MSQTRTGVRLELDAKPSSVRVIGQTIEQLSAGKRAVVEDRLRSEGFAAATGGAAQTLDKATEELEALREVLSDSVAETAAKLAVEIAQELLRKELSAGNYDIVAIVRGALTAVNNSSGGMTLLLNPVDAEALAEVPFRTGTVIQPDASVRRGDVQLRTSQGLLVREVDECIETIRRNLREALREC